MRLGPKTRIFLDILVSSGLEALGTLSAPGYHLQRGCGWDDSDSWRKQLARLESNGYLEIERDSERSGWVVKVTSAGSDKINDGIDPIRRWDGEWDGRWHLMSFDLPSWAGNERYELREWLARRRFGGLQGSVKITAFFEDDWREELRNLKVPPECMVLFEGKPYGVNSDVDVVRSAWDFDSINANYQKLIDFHSDNPMPSSDSDTLTKWLSQETSLWREAFESDPFLPATLLPSKYLGRKAFDIRKEVYRLL